MQFEAEKKLVEANVIFNVGQLVREVIALDEFTLKKRQIPAFVSDFVDPLMAVHHGTRRHFIKNEFVTIEIYEHYLVTDYLYNLLKSEGEFVTEFCGLKIWGRQTTGQCVYADDIIRIIVEKISEKGKK